MNIPQKIFLILCIPAVVAGIFFSCGRSRSELKSVATNSVTSTEEMDSIRSVLYSKGEAKAVLIAPTINRFQRPDKTVFPNGLKVIRYDSLGNIEGTLTANRGILKEAQGQFEVFDNVILRNHASNQRLLTDHLIWHRKNDSTIVETRELVRIFDADAVHTCENGAKTDDKLSWYVFYGYTYSGEVPDSTQNN